MLPFFGARASMVSKDESDALSLPIASYTTELT
jgi:hypothetical protein